MLNAQEGAQKSVTTRLRNNAQASINQDDGKVGGWTTRNHVARVLLMSRSVGNDKFALVGREVTVCHIDGDTLFAFSLQSVAQ